jgi:hypothetical protein
MPSSRQQILLGVPTRRRTDMDNPSIRVLIVDDYEPWRQFACSILRQEPNVQIIGESQLEFL